MLSTLSFPLWGRRWAGGLIFTIGAAALTSAAEFHRDSLAVPARQKFTVSIDHYPGVVQHNPRGWYYKCANVVQAKDGALVACFQLSDNHTSLSTDIVIARSTDGGRTWAGHRSIAHSDVWVDHSVWVVPQMSILRDGRIVVVCDRGERNPAQDSPMLTTWQSKARGMWNYMWWSSDSGLTWTKGEQVDAVGGEPGYVLELADGSLAYTRTSSQKTTVLRNPPAPWNDMYYRNQIVFSRDGGKTWPEAHWLADSPFHGDCEVGLAEISPGHLIAATRIGLGNGRFGNSSRLAFSTDGGRTWPKLEPAPFYGQRPHLGKLQSGKLLVTYRNLWGTPGTRALIFSPEEHLGFQPTSYIIDENRCELSADMLTLRTAEGKRGAVEFNLQPAQDDQSRVVFEAALRLEDADVNGCMISAGCWVNFQPGRISLGDRPSAGFDCDTRAWHTYRLVRGQGRIAIAVDGQIRLDEAIDDIWVREVRFGNRSDTPGADGYAHNRSVSQWRKVSVQVTNANDYSIDWRWTPAQGYPDQFRRDRTVVLDYAYAADCGYSSWTQTPDGHIVILDYTNGGNLDSFVWGGVGEGAAPFIRAYLVDEAGLRRP